MFKIENRKLLTKFQASLHAESVEARRGDVDWKIYF